MMSRFITVSSGDGGRWWGRRQFILIPINNIGEMEHKAM